MISLRNTSLFAYVEILENLGERQLEVLKTIDMLKSCCDFQIAEHLEKPINTITPRRNELLHMNLIKESGTRISPS